MYVEHLVGTLGGKKITGFELRDEMDIVDAIKAGLNPKVVDYVIEAQELTRKETEELIIPRSTLAFRKKHKMSLTLEESEHMVRIARIIAQARDVFANPDKAGQWLRRPNHALKNRIPLMLLDTEEGARIVETTLGQIAHGLFSRGE